jgi:membrane protein required for colicin V production
VLMHFGQWSLLDYLFAIIVLVSMIGALRKGLIREIVSLVALIGGFILAVWYYQVPAAWMAELARTETIANLLGFLIIFIGCILLGIIASFIINRFVKAASLKWIDRLLGAIFGFLRGWAVSSILVLALVAFPLRENMIAQSSLAPFLLAGARAAVLLVPQNLKDKFYEQYRKILQTWNENRDKK